MNLAALLLGTVLSTSMTVAQSDTTITETPAAKAIAETTTEAQTAPAAKGQAQPIIQLMGIDGQIDSKSVGFTVQAAPEPKGYVKVKGTKIGSRKSYLISFDAKGTGKSYVSYQLRSNQDENQVYFESSVDLSQGGRHVGQIFNIFKNDDSTSIWFKVYGTGSVSVRNVRIYEKKYE